VGLAGGVFQNRYLFDGIQQRLAAAGFSLRLNAALPCNDGALAYGQIIEAACRHRQSPLNQ